MRKTSLLAVIIGVTALVVGAVLLLMNQKPDLENVTTVTDMVGQHYELPSNEKPALLTVQDTSKIKSEFFRRAENGDKLLIYKDNKIAILYRPSTDRIIEVGPVSMADMAEQ